MTEYKAMIIFKEIIEKLTVEELQRLTAWFNVYVSQKEDTQDD